MQRAFVRPCKCFVSLQLLEDYDVDMLPCNEALTVPGSVALITIQHSAKIEGYYLDINTNNFCSRSSSLDASDRIS